EMLVTVEGTGNVKVMITIESGEQYIYAQAEKTNSDLSTNDASETKETNEKSTYQSDYIIVEDDSGGKKALTETTLQPEIKGVAVVCEGADNIAVQDNITQMVSTVLGISTNRVCVIKMINGK
ncbi:MAG: stage III sporulation protein AG, partial [Oscillospiraceae bacterium]